MSVLQKNIDYAAIVNLQTGIPQIHQQFFQSRTTELPG